MAVWVGKAGASKPDKAPKIPGTSAVWETKAEDSCSSNLGMSGCTAGASVIGGKVVRGTGGMVRPGIPTLMGRPACNVPSGPPTEMPTERPPVIPESVRPGISVGSGDNERGRMDSVGNWNGGRVNDGRVGSGMGGMDNVGS